MKLNWILSIAIGLSFLGESNAQGIPSSRDDIKAPCGICVPDNWVKITGTPDMSTSTIVAASTTSGGGQPWTKGTLALPPNKHESWITIRDVGTKAGEEAIQTTMTGLVAERDYEVVIYTMTAKADVADRSRNKYSPTYIDSFDFQVGTYPRISVNKINRDTDNVWGINRLVFRAQGNSMPLKFYPGFNANTSSFESVNISVSLNAINTLPVGQNFEESVRQKNQPVTLDVGSKAVDHDAGQTPQLKTIDLDVNKEGIQKEFVDATGTWKADENGNVTFTPMTDFEGQATIEYTIQDNYRIDGVLSPGTSIPKTIKINIPPCTTAVKGSDFAVESTKKDDPNGIKTFTMPATDYGFQFDIYSLDNSFQLNINGTNLATQEIDFQPGTSANQNIEFIDGDKHGEGSVSQIYSFTGDKNAPIVRVKIGADNSVKILARKSDTDKKLYEMKFFGGTTFNQIQWNTMADNVVIATQNYVGKTIMSGYGSGLKKIVCPCTREALIGTPIGSANVGISTNTITNAKWPSDIKNAALVLDSNSKGMVISRIKNVATDIKAPIEGMIAYDETDQCVKLYNGESWDCLNNACAQ